MIDDIRPIQVQTKRLYDDLKKEIEEATNKIEWTIKQNELITTLTEENQKQVKFLSKTQINLENQESKIFERQEYINTQINNITSMIAENRTQATDNNKMKSFMTVTKRCILIEER